MKLFLRIITLSFLLQVFSVLYTMAEKPEDLILKVLINQEAKWNNGDLLGYMQGYWKSDSLIFIGKKGPNYGWENTLQNYKKAYPSKIEMGKLRFGILKIDLINDKNALLIGSWELEKAKGCVSGYFSLVFRKINGEWVIIADHSS